MGQPGRGNRWQHIQLLGWLVVLLGLAIITGQAQPTQVGAAGPSPTACPPNVVCPAPVSPGSGGATVPVAVNSGVQLGLEAGLGGYARTGSWLPLYLNLTNNGSGLNGELVISVAPGTPPVGYYGYNQRPVELYTSLYVQPLDLAAGGRKQLTMYVPLASYDLFNQTIRVELRGTQGGGDQKLLAVGEAGLKQLLNQALVGVLSPTPDSFQLYDNIVIGQPQTTNAANVKGQGPLVHLALARLDSSHLPTIGQALGSLNALVVHNYDLGTLSPAQAVALESWVRSGGYLIISGGVEATASLKGLPQTLLPVAIPGPQDSGPLNQTDQQSLETIGGAALPPNSAGISYLSHLKPLPEASVSLKGGQWPLIVTLRRGGGAVVMTAFDLSEKRFVDWDGSSALWDNLLGSSQLNGSAGNIYSAYGLNSNVLNGGVSNILTNIPGVSIPSLKVIALLAFLYILVVGPLNYFVLRRLGRRELSWLTLPVLTLVFAFGIYLFALRDKGTDTITSSINIVRLDARDAQSGPLEKSALGMVGVFAPNNNSYALGLPASSLVSAVPSYLPNYLPAAQPIGGQSGQPATPVPQPSYQPPVGLRIVQGDRPQVDLLGMSQWSFRSVVVEGTVRLAGGLSANLAQRDGRIQGTVTNRTGQTLSEVIVLSSFGLFRLPGTLPSGASAAVDFPNLFGQPGNLVNSFKGVSYGAPYGAYTGSSLSSADRIEARKRDLLNLLYSSLPNSTIPALYNGGAVPQVAVIGWLDRPLLQYSVNGRQIGGNDLTMLVADASLDPARSNELLPGSLRGRVVDKQETPLASPTAPNQANLPVPPRPTTAPQGASLEVGQVTVEFDLAGQLAGRSPDRLVLESPGYVYRKNPYGVQVAPRYTVEMYNFKTDRWQVVPVVLAPPACLDAISPYQGGPVQSIISSFGLNNNSSPVNGACQAAIRGVSVPGGGYPPTSTAGPSSTLRAVGSTAGATGTAAASTARSILTVGPVGGNAATPSTGTLYANGPADNFVVLENGPNFQLADLVGSDGRVRVRYARDATVSDVMYWYYFTIGYGVK